MEADEEVDDDAAAAEAVEELLRAPSLSKTVFKLFLLTVWMPVGLFDTTGTGLSKLEVGLGAILGMVPAI